MGFAEVCVNSPATLPTFTYSIPEGMPVKTGQAVWVPFGQKVLQGIVIELTSRSAVEATRDIGGIIEPEPVLSPPRIELARWMSQRYLSPLFDAVALMLPPGFERRVLTFFTSTGKSAAVLQLEDDEARALGLAVQGHDSLGEIEKALGKKKAQSVLSTLVKKGLLTRRYELGPVRVKPRVASYLFLIVDREAAFREADRLRGKRAGKQAELLEFLGRASGPVPLSQARTIASDSIINVVVRSGVIARKEVEISRGVPAAVNEALSNPLSLTVAQQSALDAIKSAVASGRTDIFLLHGVTGSGKTEVYLQALAEVVKRGKKAIVLVPEISLTPQTVERFASRFPGRVVLLHSGLSLGEQFDRWHQVRKGEYDVVIGPRSALFAPQPELGIIIVDEEHEWSYKEGERPPRYHARDVAVKLGELTGAVVVLGSATPDVESYYRAQAGEYRLLRLPERVVPSEGSPLPEVQVVDMREELKAGNRSILSRTLEASMRKALEAGEQVILFLNRRGTASFIQCRRCGFILKCRRCDAALSLHTLEDILVCHHCNLRLPVPRSCPSCSGGPIKFLGAGTQKVEQEVGLSFPHARVLRWDSDVTTSARSHQDILSCFRNHEADILVGTQMVAKGLDVPSVSLVGVINADTGLNLPDFRAAERTFQLLSQVAGRAGRGPSGGRVIIQTFSPEHYAVKAAARHDYEAFYRQEMEFRRRLGYPPFTGLARLAYMHPNSARCQREAERVAQILLQKKDARGLSIGIIGPTPAFEHKLRGRFRWQIVLRGPGLADFLARVRFPAGWSLDIDPVGLV